jgi:hypothetical protein
LDGFLTLKQPFFCNSAHGQRPNPNATRSQTTVSAATMVCTAVVRAALDTRARRKDQRRSQGRLGTAASTNLRRYCRTSRPRLITARRSGQHPRGDGEAYPPNIFLDTMTPKVRRERHGNICRQYVDVDKDGRWSAVREGAAQARMQAGLPLHDMVLCLPVVEQRPYRELSRTVTFDSATMTQNAAKSVRLDAIASGGWLAQQGISST